MDDLQTKMNSILSDPEAMQKISAMAQSLGLGQNQPAPDAPLPEIDPSMLQKLSGLAKGTTVDKNQQSLLHALGPYLSRERLGKLERAMRAAKMAKMASSFLGR